MLSIDKRYKEELFINRIFNIFLFAGIVLLLIKNISDKKKIRKK
jgi:hypothetical protein